MPSLLSHIPSLDFSFFIHTDDYAFCGYCVSHQHPYGEDWPERGKSKSVQPQCLSFVHLFLGGYSKPLDYSWIKNKMEKKLKWRHSKPALLSYVLQKTLTDQPISPCGKDGWHWMRHRFTYKRCLRHLCVWPQFVDNSYSGFGAISINKARTKVPTLPSSSRFVPWSIAYYD